jgi:hypothetical protein
MASGRRWLAPSDSTPNGSNDRCAGYRKRAGQGATQALLPLFSTDHDRLLNL